MNRSRVLAPIAAVALAAATLTAAAAPAAARPATSCAQLAKQLTKTYDTFEYDVHKYGQSAHKTEVAYHYYIIAKFKYERCL